MPMWCSYMARGSSQTDFDAAVKKACQSYKKYFEFGTSEEVRIPHYYVSEIEKKLSNPERVKLLKKSYTKHISIHNLDDLDNESLFWLLIEKEFEIVVEESKYDRVAYNLLGHTTSLLIGKEIPIPLWPFAIKEWARARNKRELEAPPGKGGRASQYFRNKVIVTIIDDLVDKHGLTPTRNAKSKTKQSAADAAVKAYLITECGYPIAQAYDEEDRRDYEANYDKLYATFTKVWTNKDRLISSYWGITYTCWTTNQFPREFPLSELS